MEKAYYNTTKQLVTVAEFMARAGASHKDKHIFPYCPGCGAKLTVYAAHSHESQSDFRHPELPLEVDPRDDCIYAHRQREQDCSLKPSSLDETKRTIVRERFFENENLRMAYGFMFDLCGKGSLKADSFRTCTRRADIRGVWAYHGIQLWVIPYILLTFGDFIKQGQNGEFTFRFVFDKPKRAKAEALWITPEKCSLKKVFADSGNTIAGQNNPLPVSKQQYHEVAQRHVKWIKDELLYALKKELA